jgi:hypothetical protein
MKLDWSKSQIVFSQRFDKGEKEERWLVNRILDYVNFGSGIEKDGDGVGYVVVGWVKLNLNPHPSTAKGAAPKCRLVAGVA